MNEWMKCGCRCRAMFTWLQTSPRCIIFSTKINQHASTVDCRLVVASRWQINPQFIKCPEDNVLVSIMRCSAQSTLSACTLHISDCVPITAYRFCIISSLFSRIASQHSPFAVRHLYSGWMILARRKVFAVVNYSKYYSEKLKIL